MVRYNEFLFLYDLYQKNGKKSFNLSGAPVESSKIYRWSLDGILIKVKTEKCEKGYYVKVWKLSDRFIYRINSYKKMYGVDEEKKLE